MSEYSIYVILRNFLFLIFVFFGYLMSKSNKNKIEFILFYYVVIFFYVIIEGFRFGRGIDYFHYEKLYINALNLNEYWDVTKIEPIFRWLNFIIKSVDYPVSGIFAVYSLISIFCGLIFLKWHYKVIAYALPLFFLYTIAHSENLIRQTIAFGFILISSHFFLEKKWIKFILLVLIAFFIHKSILILIPFFFLMFIPIKGNINLIIILSIYVTTWIIGTSYLANNYQIINLIDIETYSSYIENSQRWFSGETLLDWNLSTLYLVRTFFYNLAILILGYNIIQKHNDNNLYFYYMLFTIGAITQRLTLEVELLFRLHLIFYFFGFLLVAYICFDTFKNESSKINKLICIFLLLNSYYNFLGIDINRPASECFFIWNK